MHAIAKKVDNLGPTNHQGAAYAPIGAGVNALVEIVVVTVGHVGSWLTRLKLGVVVISRSYLSVRREKNASILSTSRSFECGVSSVDARVG